jgi:hypothetical protein
MKFLRLWPIVPTLTLSFSVLAAPEPTERFRVVGKVEGWGELRKDGNVDVALVLPSLRSEDILAFDLAALLAPNEPMKVGPRDVPVPGNLYAPRQTENYGFIPLGIEKQSYSAYVQPGQSEELSTTWVRAPFRALKDYGDGDIPYTELLTQAQVLKSGLSEDRDWSAVAPGQATLSFNKTRETPSSYAWTRARPASGDEDVIVSFQKTNALRWMVADFTAGQSATGPLTSIRELSNKHRYLFARLLNDASGELSQMRGHFRKASRGDRLTLQGLPSELAGRALANNELRWTPPGRPGWVAVVREPRSAALRSGMPGVRQIEGWEKASKGRFTLERPVSTQDLVSLVFIATESDIDDPFVADDDSPLLELATELHLYRLN